MSRRTVVRTSVRIAVGIVTLAVGAGVVAGASRLTLPTLSETPAGRVVTPVALDQQRVCSGSLLRLAGDTGASATTVTSVGAASLSTAAGSGVSPTTTILQGADGSASAPSLVTAPTAGGAAPLVAGAESQTVAEPDLTGFAAAACVEPTNSTWLVGGSTDTGRTTLIDLVNASDVNSTVDLSVWGENGTVQGPGLEGIVVAPKSQKVVPLSGFATDLSSPVVHVTSRGGLIAANLQVSVVRTLEPGGVDIVSGTAAPARSVSIPGIVVVGSSVIDSDAAQPGYSDLKTILRAFVPGSKDAQLSIQLSSAEGTGATFTVTAQAGQVTDVPLDGLPDGHYTASVVSNVPVVAGVRSSSASANGAIDLSWSAAATPLGSTALFVVAEGPRPQLTLANPGTKSVVASFRQESGGRISRKVTTVTVPGGSSVTTRVTAGGTVTLTGASGLRGAVSFTNGGEVASYPITSPSAVSSPVKVYP